MPGPAADALPDARLLDRPRLLTGWGRTAPTAATLARPRTPAEVAELLAGTVPARGWIARGLGRSYGDAAQNAGGVVVDVRGLDRIRSLDPTSGVVDVEAGVTVDQLLRHVAPLGWFPPVLPGTGQVTLGGALAADVHGKNHHVAGSLSHHVAAIDLVLPGGELRQVTAAADPALFWGTAGGMGLTGVVVGLRLRLRAVTSPWLLADTWRAADLDQLLRLLVDAEQRFGYAVAWIDVTAAGRGFGRGVVSAAEHADPDDLPRRARRRAGGPAAPRPAPAVPAAPPLALVNAATIRGFNEAWYRRAPRHRTSQPAPPRAFFTPLDGVAGWNLLYGRHGFVQYQLVVPDEGALRAALALIRRHRLPSFLTVLKRFGPAAPGPLSFPRPGWTLACDVPADVPRLGAALDELDDLVAGAGGRVYLAKDARLRPDLLAAMYPQVGELRALLDRVDPSRSMASDLARRLAL